MSQSMGLLLPPQCVGFQRWSFWMDLHLCHPVFCKVAPLPALKNLQFSVMFMSLPSDVIWVLAGCSARPSLLVICPGGQSPFLDQRWQEHWVWFTLSFLWLEWRCSLPTSSPSKWRESQGEHFSCSFAGGCCVACGFGTPCHRSNSKSLFPGNCQGC